MLRDLILGDIKDDHRDAPIVELIGTSCEASLSDGVDIGHFIY